MNTNNTQDGFIARILLIIVALIAIKYYYHFDVLAYLKTPEAHKVIDPVWNAIKAIYFWVDNLFKNWTTR